MKAALVFVGLLIAPPAVAKPMPTHDTHAVDMRGFTDGMWPAPPKAKRAKVYKRKASRRPKVHRHKAAGSVKVRHPASTLTNGVALSLIHI